MTDDPRDLIRRPVDPAEYDAIRNEWKRHSIAEDNRDIAGLLATLTPDCVYEVAQDRRRWEGHAGAAAFYAELLDAFPDVHFQLTHIVIGPQGVAEEAEATATHQGTWGGRAATGRRVKFRVVIFFPWDPARRKFLGERVWYSLEEVA